MLVTGALEDISAHFLLRRCPWCQGRKMWSVVWLVREMRYQAYYILGIDRRLFRNVTAWDLSCNLDHYMVLGYLCSATLTEHADYFGRYTRIPL